MSQEISNSPASVKDRLRNHARQTGQTFHQILVYYVLERFLYRLSQSPASDRFILKGALLMLCWPTGLARATSDIDLSAPTQSSIDTISQTLKRICQTSVEPDGVIFDAESFETEILMTGEDNPGIRFKFWAYIEKTRIRMRIDVGFGDPITPEAEIVDYPTILQMPAPRLRSYPKETVVAEKFHAVVRLGEINSRLKDFFDIAHMIRTFNFEGTLLSTAIQRTFKSRNSPIPAETPPGLSSEFADENQPTWETFLRGARDVDSEIHELQSVLSEIRSFLLPIARAINNGELFDKKWTFTMKWQ